MNNAKIAAGMLASAATCQAKGRACPPIAPTLDASYMLVAFSLRRRNLEAGSAARRAALPGLLIPLIQGSF